ncbi:hypothetical protein NHX12_004368 [Muraenolepis orangiensis]|uniref:Uncharacterized protein n=1 Tax=Muraenolepis orangiensis TaxID=630683 RepID=A0A9Q0IEJ8_9TELE|nr:hypothetical protein NHX12_004368 [Muraenolepis orangiensis]
MFSCWRRVGFRRGEHRRGPGAQPKVQNSSSEGALTWLAPVSGAQRYLIEASLRMETLAAAARWRAMKQRSGGARAFPPLAQGLRQLAFVGIRYS